MAPKHCTEGLIGRIKSQCDSAVWEPPPATLFGSPVESRRIVNRSRHHPALIRVPLNRLLRPVNQEFRAVCSQGGGGYIEPVQLRNEDRDLCRWAGWNLGDLLIVVRILLRIDCDEPIAALNIDLLPFRVIGH